MHALSATTTTCILITSIAKTAGLSSLIINVSHYDYLTFVGLILGFL